MKQILLFILIFTAASSSYGAIYQIKRIDSSQNDSDTQYLYQEEVNDLSLDENVHNLIFTKVDSVEKEACPISAFRIIKFKKMKSSDEKGASGSYYAILSSEDSCDGGNSMGIIIDSNKQFVSEVFDGDFDL